VQDTIERDDLDYEALGIPSVSNGEIGPALEGEDEHGWTKDATWVMQAESSGACGDYAIGPYYQGHYACGPNAEGEYMVVEENYFVTAHWYEDHETGERRMNFDVTGMYGFTLCSDPQDPGGTEINSDYEYDDGLHAQFIWEYDEARKLAERNALSDQRGTFTWRR
jgi:hypothetical protein